MGGGALYPVCDYLPVTLTPIVMKGFERFVKSHIAASLPQSLDPFLKLNSKVFNPSFKGLIIFAFHFNHMVTLNVTATLIRFAAHSV